MVHYTDIVVVHVTASAIVVVTNGVAVIVPVPNYFRERFEMRLKENLFFLMADCLGPM